MKYGDCIGFIWDYIGMIWGYMGLCKDYMGLYGITTIYTGILWYINHEIQGLIMKYRDYMGFY